MSTLRFLIAVCLASVFAAINPAFGASGDWNGVAFTSWNSVGVTSWNGTSISTAGGGGGYTLVAQLLESPTGGNTYTTAAINTTGADLIVIWVGTYNGWIPNTPTDSQSNTYTPVTGINGAVEYGQFFFVHNPTTNSAQTFTVTATTMNYYTIAVLAFSGSAASPLDTSGGVSNNLSLSTGSITTAGNGELVVTGIHDYASGNGPTLGSPWTYYSVAKSGNVGAGGVAWQVQSSAGSISATWTDVGMLGSDTVRAIAAFK